MEINIHLDRAAQTLGIQDSEQRRGRKKEIYSGATLDSLSRAQALIVLTFGTFNTNLYTCQSRDKQI